MSSNLKVNNILPSTGTTVAVSGIASVTSSVSIASSCTATTFYGSGANLTALNLVTDSSPQLGGNLDCNNKNISLNDSTGSTNNRIKIGTHDDLHLWHNSSTGNSNISNYNGDLYIQGNNGSGTGVNQIAIKSNAAVELNYQGTKKFETSADGIKLYPDASGVLISSGGDTNWTTGAMNVVKLGGNQADIRLGSNYGVRIGISGNNDANEFMIQQDNSNNAYVRNEATNPIRFQTGGSNTRFQIDNSGDCTINDGNLVIGTGGHGIDFSASGGPQGSGTELLNDYEVGTFTPVLQGSSGSGTATHNHQSGNYVKIGRNCTIFFNIYTTNTASWSGNLRIAGLPFTVGSSIEAVAAAQWNRLPDSGSGSSTQSVFAILQHPNTFVEFRKNQSGTSQFNYLSVQNVHYLRVSMSYITA